MEELFSNISIVDDMATEVSWVGLRARGLLGSVLFSRLSQRICPISLWDLHFCTGSLQTAKGRGDLPVNFYFSLIPISASVAAFGRG